MATVNTLVLLVLVLWCDIALGKDHVTHRTHTEEHIKEEYSTPPIPVPHTTVSYSTPKPYKIDMKCRPIDKFADCPLDYCCVRDEFLPTYVYCKAIGEKEEHCTTSSTESECPCGHGLYCRPNIQSSSHSSIYGVCTSRIIG